LFFDLEFNLSNRFEIAETNSNLNTYLKIDYLESVETDRKLNFIVNKLQPNVTVWKLQSVDYQIE
jgi:hypothetical protein